ncbi:MAG TPA: glycosyltransferase [Phototrophicaceae bacterium]|nr:glycosyltransferase [Phototrophicaceae bacterium]
MSADEATAPKQRLGERLIAQGYITQSDLDRALELQARTKERLGSILMSLNLIKRYQLYQVLAELWGYPFINLLEAKADPELVRRFHAEILVRERFLPVRLDATSVEIASAEQPSDDLTALIRATLGAELDVRYFVTTEWDIDRTLSEVFREELVSRATFGLYYRNPRESAFTVMTRWQFFALIGALALLLFGLFFATVPTLVTLNLLINVGFSISILFKFVTAMAGAYSENVEAVTAAEVAALKDDELPLYTILVPVYREANIVSLLMQNMRDIDYPAGRLEILLLMEEDDHETLDAARASHPPETVTFVIIPDGLPRTKPRACNVGLFFAKGEYLVIFDAEDRPEPDQLKKAVVAFNKGGEKMICVQAALNYFNVYENWLTRMFTLEYSYWFDYILTGLQRLNLPIPLGGTSNHFRTDALRRLGGWDPFNVTEDADLGIRASAEGYTVGVINSTTYEEANNHRGNWVRQRSRWIKGYMQTVLVHLRNPIGMVRSIGIKNTLGFIMLIAGTPITFLCTLPLWGLYLVWLITRTHLFDPLFPPAILYLGLFNLLIGNSVMIYLNMLAVFKRRYYGLIGYAVLNPVYWLLHSVASYKALWQLFTKPFFWEKTLHGISNQLAHPPGSTAPPA